MEIYRKNSLSEYTELNLCETTKSIIKKEILTQDIIEILEDTLPKVLPVEPGDIRYATQLIMNRISYYKE